MKKYIAKSLSEYISIVSKITEEECGIAWFRGHQMSHYQLTPSVLRDIIPLTDARGNSLKGNERLNSSGCQMTGINPERLLNEFKRRAVHLVDERPQNDFEWLFIMQHYGVKTRLLDWTTNALVALYFAVDQSQDCSSQELSENGEDDITINNVDEQKSASVFVMNPNKFNEQSTTCSRPIDLSNEFTQWEHYTRPTEHPGATLPICVLAPSSSSRIRAQSGVFTLHGSMTTPLESYYPIQEILHKIYIPLEFSGKIQRDLEILGITKFFIYQDLDSLSHDIMKEECKRFNNERKDYLLSFES